MAHGDWLIFLDLARNRYQAVASIGAPGAREPKPVDLARSVPLNKRAALLGASLVTKATRDQSFAPPQPGVAPSWSDLVQVMRAALWARRIVKRGKMLDAFCALSKGKARLSGAAAERALVDRAVSRFAAARLWAPAPYVCLFDSLVLMRFLLARGVRADLVFGVRSRPFAAHCWVEVDGVILDDGGEACGSFAEIVRV